MTDFLFGSRPPDANSRVAELLQAMGYEGIKYDFVVAPSVGEKRPTLGRADVYGWTTVEGEKVEALVVIRRDKKYYLGEICGGVGQLLLFKEARPDAKLFLAIPGNLASKPLDDIIHDYLKRYDIKLLRPEVPQRHGPRRRPTAR